jgi:RNA-binding motif protein, X-linked 2
MNAIRQTALLNKRELENATPPSASWHTDYRDTAWVYIGGLPLDLTEGDVVTIFSQFGNPTHLNLIRDKETGKLKGFGFLKYEDQRSCDLAVDNLGGAEVLGRMLRVDHTRYKRRDDEDDGTWRIDKLEAQANREMEREASDTDQEGSERGKKRRRKMLKEERELDEMLAITADGEDEDPMRQYIIDEKREEVQKAREKEDRREQKHRHHHRRRREGEEDDEDSHRRHRHMHKRGSDDRRNRDNSPRRNGRSGHDRRDRDRSPKDNGRSHRDRKDLDRDRSRARRRSPSKSRSPR